MGTICTPSHPNIFMGHFEKEFIYPFMKTFSLMRFRFIDNIFFKWTGSKVDVERFLNELNKKHRKIENIQRKYKISKERISFL